MHVPALPENNPYHRKKSIQWQPRKIGTLFHNQNSYQVRLSLSHNHNKVDEMDDME